MSRATELAEAHWGYISNLLKNSGVGEQEVLRIEFHYKTAMVHGYKHGVEDAKL